MHKKLLNNRSVTIVICTFNGAVGVFESVEALISGSKYPEEVIVVDNNSSESEKKQLASIGKLVGDKFKFRCIEESRQGLGYAREAGVRHAKSEYILFVDDDNILDFNFMESLQRILILRDCDYCGCRTVADKRIVDLIKPYCNDLLKAYAIGELYKNDMVLTTNNPIVWGAGLCVRRTAYLETLQRFGPLILNGRSGAQMYAGDDTEICMRLAILNYRGYYSNELSLAHNVKATRFSEENFIRTYFGFGFSMPVIREYHAILNNANIGLFYWLKRIRVVVAIYYLLKYFDWSILNSRSLYNRCMAAMYLGALSYILSGSSRRHYGILDAIAKSQKLLRSRKSS